MITSNLFLLFLGSWVLYNTSKKAILNQNFHIEKWIQSHAFLSKLVGLFFLLTSLSLMTLNFGTTSGVLFWLVSLMTILGLIIIIAPLHKGNLYYFLILFIVILLLEII